MSDCELTDTYSPAAIDMAPATSPATPAIKTSFSVAAAAANADDQACGRNDAVVGSEHCGSQPTDTLDQVVFRVQSQTS